MTTCGSGALVAHPGVRKPVREDTKCKRSLVLIASASRSGSPGNQRAVGAGGRIGFSVDVDPFVTESDRTFDQRGLLTQ